MITAHRRTIVVFAALLTVLVVAAALTWSRGDAETQSVPTLATVPGALSGGDTGEIKADGPVSFVWWGPVGSLSVDDDSSGEADHQFVIPAGAGASIEAGEEINILPEVLEVRVGETIEIVNDDDQLHFVGPFTVGEGESLRQRFSESGESIGICSAHVLGSVKVVVLEA